MQSEIKSGMREVLQNVMLMLPTNCGCCFAVLYKLIQSKQVLDKPLQLEKYSWKPILLLPEMMCTLDSVFQCPEYAISSLKYAAVSYLFA